jgi:hypothetical protein
MREEEEEEKNPQNYKCADRITTECDDDDGRSRSWGE